MLLVYLAGGFGLLMFILTIINNYSTNKIFCNFFGWHKQPEIKEYFGGGNLKGECPRCRKSVMLDSQGNWV